MTRAVVIAVGLLLLASPARADDAQALAEANLALQDRNYQRALELVEPVVALADRVARIDLAEAHRLRGLALFYLDRPAEAEAALLAYLRIEPDGQIDPARHPPEVIVFFADVRARHRAELAGLRERPRTVREWSKNLFPPWGQFANGHRTKGWIVGGALVTMVAANLATYAVLSSWCDSRTGVCRSDTRERRKTAITLQWINIGAGIGAVATYAYGVIDGFYHHRQISRAETPRYMSVGVSRTNGGAAASLTLRF